MSSINETSNKPNISTKEDLQEYVRSELTEVMPEVMRKFKDRIQTAPDSDIPKLFDQICEYTGVAKTSAKVNLQAGLGIGATIASGAITDALKAMASGLGVDVKDVTPKVEKIDEIEVVEEIEIMEEVEDAVEQEQEINPLEF